MVMGPQLAGGEANYVPEWALLTWENARWQSPRPMPSTVQKAIRLDARNTEPPATLTVRLDTLRAFALLRGWRFERGTWYR